MTTESMNSLLESATRILFFTGKGGVGKTSLACAAAVSMAQQGRKVLLVSTDPASNLDEVLGVRLSSAPTAIPGAGGLFALNIDPEAAAKAYRDRVIGPYRGVLPEASLNSMEEQLSGACTVEIAAFDEFTKLLGDAHATAGFDHIIFDMAPTGHTLRLLQLPAAWTGFIAENTTGTSCLGPLAGLETQKSLYDSSLQALTDASTTTLVLVSRPERSSLAEANRTRAELAEMGIANQRLFLNGLFVAQDRSDAAACALEVRGQEALALPIYGYRQSAVVSQRPLWCAGSQRCRRVRTRGPRPGSTRRDARRARETSANRGSAAPIRSDGRGEPPECVRRRVADSQGGAQRPVRRDPFRTSPFVPDRRTRKDGARCRDDDGEGRRR